MNTMANRISRSTAVAAALVIGGGVIQSVSAEGYQTRLPREPAQAQGQSERAGTSLQEILDAHNRLRRQWGVSALGWNNALAQRAHDYAIYLASTGKFEHGDTAGVGQNLWEGGAGYFSRTHMVGSWGN